MTTARMMVASLAGLLLLASGCRDGRLDEVGVRLTGRALVNGAPVGRRLLVQPQDADSEPQMSVSLSVRGRWAESGGVTCKDDGLIDFSQELPIVVDDDGRFEVTGVIPLAREAPKGGHAPVSCYRARTGVYVDALEKLTLYASLWLVPWDGDAVVQACREEATGACASSDSTCVYEGQQRCVRAAWKQTLWYRSGRMECIGAGWTDCEYGGGGPVTLIPDRLDGRLEPSPEALMTVEDGLEASGRLELESDMAFSFKP